MVCPKCNTVIPGRKMGGCMVVICPNCHKLWYEEDISLFWQGFCEGRNNKKNTAEVCAEFGQCDINHDACPSQKCDSFVEPR